MYSKKQRIGAIGGVVLLLLLYIVNFFIGIFTTADTFSLFLASLLATFFIPVMIFFYIKFLDYVKEKSVEETEDDPEEQDETK